MSDMIQKNFKLILPLIYIMFFPPRWLLDVKMFNQRNTAIICRGEILILWWLMWHLDITTKKKKRPMNSPWCYSNAPNGTPYLQERNIFTFSRVW